MSQELGRLFALTRDGCATLEGTSRDGKKRGTLGGKAGGVKERVLSLIVVCRHWCMLACPCVCEPVFICVCMCIQECVLACVCASVPFHLIL